MARLPAPLPGFPRDRWASGHGRHERAFGTRLWVPFDTSLAREPEHAGDFTKFPPELPPGVAPIVAAVEIPVAAAGKDHLGGSRLHVHDPHGRVGLCRQAEALPGPARIS